MKKSKMVYLILLIIPWLTIPLLGKNAFKKYLPSALFIVIFTKAIDIFGEKRKWWRFYKGIGPFDSMNFFNLGPYFVTSLWMLKWTYGKFIVYLMSNEVLHIFFIFLGGLKFAKHFKVFSLVKLTKLQYLFINLIRGFSLYGFQYIYGLRTKISNKG